MTKHERIINFFQSSLRTKEEQIAFIIALELSGENLIANSCKRLFEDKEASQ
jgi:hypothetical protein